MINKVQGLPGLNYLSKEERDAFMLDNADKLKKYRTARDREKAADVLYNNHLFKEKFGEDTFNKFNNGSKEAYEYRNELLKNTVTDEAFSNRFSPIDENGMRDDSKGLGEEWEKYNMMTPDAKLKLLESDYLSPKEFEDKWKKEKNNLKEIENSWQSSLISMMPGGMGTALTRQPSDIAYGETAKQAALEKNSRVREQIYNDNVDYLASQLGDKVKEAYFDSSIRDLSDEDVVKQFVYEATPGSYPGNLGIPEYAAHYGDGSDRALRKGDMDNFSIDQMREVLAKKKVYSQYMDPTMVSTALNNDAKRYIKGEQNLIERGNYFAKDVVISALSYTFDKFNSVYNIGLIAEDALGDKPVVLVDDQGQILDKNKVAVSRDELTGELSYRDEKGVPHRVSLVEMNRSTLHNMGKNFDGSENMGALNPQYWTKAEQFGTLNRAEQAQYEKLGASPYKVMFDPNKDTDLWYESFKMASFGLADGMAQLIPFGIGQAGKALSTASKIGKVGQGIGRAMEVFGSGLTYQTKTGQVIQGLLGAGGIGYAYQRGAFQETLAKNMAENEKATLAKARDEVYNRYQNDKQYKAQIDADIKSQISTLKQQYELSNKENGISIVDKDSYNEMLKQRAQDIVLGSQVEQRYNDIKQNSPEYAQLQAEAINDAGQVAVNTFWPEAVKYGLVNTLGYRKWLYTNPTGVTRKISSAFKGLKEITTADGRQRLMTEASKFLTNKQKWAERGKIAGQQLWGGSWTNGTDDMMVDAAERVGADSYTRYINGFNNGEAIADVYGFGDGLYSYWNGLNNSLGQSTTWNAAAVGGLGSLFSVSPNMANIASLATKSGREAYRSNYKLRTVYETDPITGLKTPKKDAEGKIVTEDISASENWRDRAAFFIQNGVLNTYYGNKQSEATLQQHADYVNALLDNYDDFNAIEDLVTSSIGKDNATSIADEKTMRFINAINAVNALNHLAEDDADPTVMSSRVQEIKNLVQKLTEDGELTDEEMNRMLGEYYSANPGVAQSEENNAIALAQIRKNAKELVEASNAYDESEEDLQKIERKQGSRINRVVRDKLKLSRALNSHWESRRESMRKEIEDGSDVNGKTIGDALIASFGSLANATTLTKVYERQVNELREEFDKQKALEQKAKEDFEEAQKNLREATTPEAEYKALEDLKEFSDKYQDAVQESKYISDLINITLGKKADVETAIHQVEANEDGKKSLTLNSTQIMALDPVTRARMMNPENRSLYSKEQVAEIENLEKTLVMKDADALTKIQDIALLTQRIATNQDSYKRMSENPEAAAFHFEAVRESQAKAAAELINTRNAYSIADVINQFDEAMKVHEDVSSKDKSEFAFRTLRKIHPRLLEIVDRERMLPQYQKEVTDAINWAQTLNDIEAVIDNIDESPEWKTNLKNNIESIVENSLSKEDIMAALEKVIDDVDNPQVAEDFEKVLNGMEKLGYQRDATIIENREQQKAREDAAKQQETAQEKTKNEADKVASNVPTEENWNNADEIGDVNLEEKIESQEETPVPGTEESRTIEEDGYIQGQPVTIDQQVTESQKTEGKEVHSSDETTDVTTLNVVGEENIDNSNATLSGNAMSMYETSSLKTDGALKEKTGAEPNDSRNKYNAWMKALGVNLQNIIDTELSEIIKRNPKAKVKFMAVRPQNNATHDADVKSHLFLVLDYDDTVNKGITSTHNEENGGVIDSQGKKYLMIGVAGYGAGNADKLAIYDILFSNNPNKGYGYGLVKRGMGEFFRNNPAERFYIPEGISSEIVPTSLIPGYIVKQLNSDESVEFRSVSDLLNDKSRNPQGLQMDDLAWGIQELTKFLVVGTSLDKVMVPRNAVSNSGSAFVLIPASNGKLVPSYLKPLFYNEMKDGKLKQRINTLLSEVVSPNYATRLQAVVELCNIFHFDSKTGNNILVGNETGIHKNQVSLVHNGTIFKTFTLDETFDPMEFMEAVKDMNPRINITASVLRSRVLLQEYDEAGALQTDIALLHTAGSSYSIYGVSPEGAVVKPETPENNVPKVTVNSNFRNTDKSQVVYKQQYYTYDVNTGTYYLNGVAVTDTKDIKALDYNRRIIEGGITPVEKNGVWNYYILGSEENSEVIKVNRNTYDVVEATPEQAQALINKIAKEAEDKARQEAAKEKLELKEVSDAVILDEESGEVVYKEQTSISKDQRSDVSRGREEEGNSKLQQQGQEDRLHKSAAQLQGSNNDMGTQSFNTLSKSKEYRKQIRDIIKQKWPDSPNNMAELAQFLKNKKIEVDAIGTSKEDVEAWIKTLQDCR